MKPWQMNLCDGRLTLEFKSFFDRVAKTNAMILASKVHQMFGRYSEILVTDLCEQIGVNNLIGLAEFQPGLSAFMSVSG